MNNLNKHAKQTCEPSWYRKKGTHKLTTYLHEWSNKRGNYFRSQREWISLRSKELPINKKENLKVKLLDFL